MKQAREVGTSPLGMILPGPHVGQVFCSTEDVVSTPRVYKDQRCKSRIRLPYISNRKVYLDYATEHIYADTMRYELRKGAQLSILAQVREVTESALVAAPLVMGAPFFGHPYNDRFKQRLPHMLFLAFEYYQLFSEDIGEFQKAGQVAEVSDDEWIRAMKDIPEREIKARFAELLHDHAGKDWGGEINDYYTAHLHVAGKRTDAAFIFKGPSVFREMKPKDLGKNGDQIFRLAQSPARLLILQHCHRVSEAVRATLRAFAVAPHDPRRYCVIDGEDTFKILTGYGKL